jgi:hypothetical protein
MKSKLPQSARNKFRIWIGVVTCADHLCFCIGVEHL